MKSLNLFAEKKGIISLLLLIGIVILISCTNLLGQKNPNTSSAVPVKTTSNQQSVGEVIKTENQSRGQYMDNISDSDIAILLESGEVIPMGDGTDVSKFTKQVFERGNVYSTNSSFDNQQLKDANAEKKLGITGKISSIVMSPYSSSDGYVTSSTQTVNGNMVTEITSVWKLSASGKKLIKQTEWPSMKMIVDVQNEYGASDYLGKDKIIFLDSKDNKSIQLYNYDYASNDRIILYDSKDILTYVQEISPNSKYILLHRMIDVAENITKDYLIIDVNTGQVVRRLRPNQKPKGWITTQHILNEIPKFTHELGISHTLETRGNTSVLGDQCTFGNFQYGYPFPTGKKYYISRAGPTRTQWTGASCGNVSDAMEDCNFPIGSNTRYTGDNPDCGHSQKAIDFVELPTVNQSQFPDNVVAMRSGSVRYSQFHSDVGFGNCVMIQHDDGTVMIYGHMENGSLAVRVNQTVIQGQKLGIEGCTGSCTGEHIHTELRRDWPKLQNGNYGPWPHEDIAYAPISECGGCVPQSPYVYGVGADQICFTDTWNSRTSAKSLNIGSGGSVTERDCLSGNDVADWFKVKITDKNKFGTIGANVRFTNVSAGATVSVTLRNRQGNVIALAQPDGSGGLFVSYCTMSPNAFILCNQCEELFFVIEYNSITKFLQSKSTVEYEMYAGYSLGQCTPRFTADTSKTIATRGYSGEFNVTFVPDGAVCPGTLVTARIIGGDNRYYVNEDRSDIQIFPSSQVIGNSETFTFVMPATGDVKFFISPIPLNPCNDSPELKEFTVKSGNFNCSVTPTTNDFRFGIESSDPRIGNWSWISLHKN